MKKLLLALLVASMLTGCAVIQSTGLTETDPVLTTQREGVKKEFDTIPEPATGKQLSVAVYSFADKTGQRRPQANVASLSTAVTQGAETFLIQALQSVGNGRWFDVVERVGIDNLVKERTIIKQMREAYEGASAKPLMPMQFAGMIIEGGIIGYDTTTTSGGAGMRIFGIGKQTQWSTDTVTVSLRMVSVNTGKVLSSVTVQKTILSTADSATALKFFDKGTQAFEAEAGLTINEPGTYAVKAAVELGVVELIKEGERKGIWEFKKPVSVIPPMPIATPVAPVPEKKVEPKLVEVKQEQPKIVEEVKVEPKLVEVKVEPKLVEVRQPNTKVEPKTVELFGKRMLKDDSFLYAEEKETSTRKWQFKKGTVLSIRQLGIDGWIRVMDVEGRGGWIKMDAVQEIPPEKLGLADKK
jgi:curli production assembly/transport component CsgG